MRVPRRLRDRVISIVMPVHRYQCIAFNCDWEGSLAVAGAPTQDPATPH